MLLRYKASELKQLVSSDRVKTILETISNVLHSSLLIDNLSAANKVDPGHRITNLWLTRSADFFQQFTQWALYHRELTYHSDTVHGFRSQNATSTVQTPCKRNVQW